MLLDYNNYRYFLFPLIKIDLFDEKDKIWWDKSIEECRKSYEWEYDIKKFVTYYFIPFVDKIKNGCSEDKKRIFFKKQLEKYSTVFPRLSVFLAKIYGIRIEDLNLICFDEWENIQRANLKKMMKMKFENYLYLDYRNNTKHFKYNYLNNNNNLHMFKDDDEIILNVATQIAETILFNKEAQAEIKSIINEAMKARDDVIVITSYETNNLIERADEIFENQDYLIDVARMLLEIKRRIDSTKDNEIQCRTK